MKKIIALLFVLVLAGCERVPSNVHALSTTDCGARWTKLTVGETVPKHPANPCGYNLAVPNWPMAGETAFKTQFAKKVLTNARLSYSYSITDPIAYISEARYLGKMKNNSLEISSDATGSQYEMAENIIIDKMLREVTTEFTRGVEIVDADPAQIEEAIYQKAKTILDAKGIEIADIALVLENEEQTRLAIDTATAIRVYESAGIKAVGEQVIIARSGATKINIGHKNE